MSATTDAATQETLSDRPLRRFLAPARFWRLREEVSPRLYSLLGVASVAVPLLAWTLLSLSGWVEPLFLPSPFKVLQAFVTLFTDKGLLVDVGVSLARVSGGFFLGALVAIPLGLLMGSFKSFQAAFEPAIGLVRYMPATAFIPLLILWLGIGEPTKLALIFIGTVFFNTLMVADAARLVPKDLINVSYTLGANRRQVFFQVLIPHALPGILDALRVNMAAAWNLVIVSELVAAQSGLGYQILRAQKFLLTDNIFVGLILIGLIGLLTDLCFGWLRSTLAAWAD
ncbi:ABC transporter permease [Anthocerotibacter panamensis]|uniref:ABC transporter permease n=1 Tax=Anthocerotibacter panamensis TaxID=2857077 RepID=UPI001C407B81|nr:ABC transporter permease [Anthocerotibacter panamensis]